MVLRSSTGILVDDCHSNLIDRAAATAASTCDNAEYASLLPCFGRDICLGSQAPQSRTCSRSSENFCPLTEVPCVPCISAASLIGEHFGRG